MGCLCARLVLDARVWRLSCVPARYLSNMVGLRSYSWTSADLLCAHTGSRPYVVVNAPQGEIRDELIPLMTRRQVPDMMRRSIGIRAA